MHPAKDGAAGGRALLRFVLLFVLYFVVLQRVYVATRDRTDHVLNQVLNARAGAALLNALLPGAPVAAREGRLLGPDAAVNIKKGCEGFDVMAVLAAAMLAYPMRWRARAVGLAVGLLIVYALNLARIVGLYLVVTRRGAWFDTAHVGVGQTAMILLAVLYFLFWIERLPRGDRPVSASPGRVS